MIELPVKRAITPKQADALVGERVTNDDLPLKEREFLLRDADTGEPVALSLRTPGDTARTREAVLGVTWSETLRGQSGRRNKSRVFGYSPRKAVLRRDGCNTTTLAIEDPARHAAVAELSGPLTAALDEILPEHARDLAAQPVDGDWRLSPGGWTSGVINRTSQLPYHRDGANFDAWSAMPAYRMGVRGGHLHLPEYDVMLPVRDGHTLFFNGFRLVHGVSPIATVRPDAYRITVVFYCLRGMKDCHTFAEETARARTKRTERERVLAAAIAAGEAPAWQQSVHNGPKALGKSLGVKGWRGLAAGSGDTDEP